MCILLKQKQKIVREVHYLFLHCDAGSQHNDDIGHLRYITSATVDHQGLLRL